MYEQTAHSLRTSVGKYIALQSVSVEASFENLLCETSMTQVYQNQEEKPIEAVYTFPLAGRAVLLGLKVSIGGRELQGVVAEKASAEEQYEDAITDSDSAIMLEQLQPGLYTMNVGNIPAGEEVAITIIYAELYSWHGDTLRFHLPTTIAPRYGSPENAGLQPHQEPEYDLLADNRFQLKLTVSGTLADADIDSPSHQIAIVKSGRDAIVTLATGKAFMDRDFILNIRSNWAEKDAVLLDRDPDGKFFALASFVPQLPIVDEISPRSVKIVVDCSGSMGGDSIAQARQAISDILNQLRPEDYFNFIAFGSTVEMFFDCQTQADRENITKVRRLLRSMNADMGGTEIQQALTAAVRLPGPDIPQDILLITDGEVWDSDEIINMAKKSGHRVFTVGVGSSVSEDFVRQLAKETGGACELVAPREEMAEKIVRHFKRIYLPRAENVAVSWPVDPGEIIPGDIGPVYDGDTLHVFACFNEKPCGPVILDMILADGRTFSQVVVLDDREINTPGRELPGSISRMAMHGALADKNEKEATELAIKYQLICPWTNYCVVLKQPEDVKGQELPRLRKVAQMVAAGWGGTGMMVRERRVDLDEPTFCRNAVGPQVMFSRAPSAKEEHKWRQQTTPDCFIHKCNDLHNKWLRPVLQLVSFNDLLACDLPDRILEALETIAAQYDSEAPEELIVPAFLQALAQSALGGEFNRNTRRAIKKACKMKLPDERLINLMVAAFADISKDDWGRQYLLKGEPPF